MAVGARVTRIVSLTLTRAEGRQSPSSYIVLLRVASAYLRVDGGNAIVGSFTALPAVMKKW